MAAADGDIQEELLKLAQLAGLSQDEGIRAAIESLPLLPSPERQRTETEKLMKYLSPLAAMRVWNGDAEEHPFLPQPEGEELPEFDVLLGLIDDLKVGVKLEDFLTHVQVSGPTKKGKTFFILSQLRQLIEHGVPTHIFDTQGDYADLLPSMCPRAKVIRYQDMRRNPFEEPPNLTQDEWLQHVTNYLRECFYYRDGVVNLFRSLCTQLREQGLKFNARTFVEEYRRVPRTVRREADYFQSLGRFVTAISNPTYQCESGFDLRMLSTEPVVFDLSNMANDWRLFFIADLVTWHHASRTYRRNRGVELVLVFDELSHFYSEEASKRSDLGEPFILQMVRESRKRGLGVILADQVYKNFHGTVRANCQTKVVFETIDGPSRIEVGRDLSLNQEQQEFLSELSFNVQPQRRVLVQIPTYPKPFLLIIPQIEMPDSRQVYEKPELEWVPLPEKEEKQEKPQHDEVSHEMDRYLATVGCNPLLTESECDALVKNYDPTHNKTRGTNIRKALMELGLLEEHKVPTMKRGRYYKVPVPTKAGYERLSKRKIGFKTLEGNGSVQHKFYQRRVKEKLQKQGLYAEVEMILRTKQVDVGSVKEGLLPRRVAYEIVWDDDLDKELSNLEKNAIDGWDMTVFAVQNEEMRDHLNAVLPDGNEQVEIRLLRELI